MKPVNFNYVHAASIEEAVRLLDQGGGTAKVIAGGQSLGPMLNLRLAQPSILVDITGIPELTKIREEIDSIIYGACITHAAIEDREVPDPANGFLYSVAGGIAYRSVRNRGTMGGSIAHADPAADWLTALTLLGAELIVIGPRGERHIPMGGLITGPFTVALDDAELITAIRIRKYSSKARLGYFKFCRKRGGFAEAMAAAIADPELNVYRGVIGATDSKPVTIEDISEFFPADATNGADVEERLRGAQTKVAVMKITGDPIKDNMLGNAFARALCQVM
jgi:carbon-monoxide dehydrogenase medium subunit